MRLSGEYLAIGTTFQNPWQLRVVWCGTTVTLCLSYLDKATEAFPFEVLLYPLVPVLEVL